MKLTERKDRLSSAVKSSPSYRSAASFLNKSLQKKDFGLYEKMEKAITEYKNDLAAEKQYNADVEFLNNALSE